MRADVYTSPTPPRWQWIAAVSIGFLLGLFWPLAARSQSLPQRIAMPVAGVWAGSVYAIHAEREFHHAYIGAALLAHPNKKVQWVGLAVLADDAAQHLIQTRKPAYRSPLHRLYAVTLYRWWF